MTEFVSTSRGDRVAYDKRGRGPAVVFVAGAGPFRAIDPVTTETAERLAAMGCTTVVYDRLGRGESPADGDIDLDRELAALAALIEVAGGHAVLCGHSSGCSISLRAAVEGPAVDGLALWEAPLVPEPGDDTQGWVAGVLERLDAGRLEEAQVFSMKDMPPEWLEELQRSEIWPAMVGQAPSLRADAESLGWATGTPLPELLGGLRIPVVAMVGTSTFPEMPRSADALVEAVPGAVRVDVPGADHTWEPVAMAEQLAGFVRS